MKNYFIVHGSYGNNQENWFPWLENVLKEKGEEVFNLNYPTPVGQNYKNWSNVLNKYKDKITKETTFICHSISPIFVVHYCIDNNIKIKKLISVSGANGFKTGDSELDELTSTFFIEDISQFKNLCEETICFYSLNDPFIPLANLKKFADDLNAKHLVYEKSGHFNASAGYIKFEDLLEFL